MPPRACHLLHSAARAARGSACACRRALPSTPGQARGAVAPQGREPGAVAASGRRAVRPSSACSCSTVATSPAVVIFASLLLGLPAVLTALGWLVALLLVKLLLLAAPDEVVAAVGAGQVLVVVAAHCSPFSFPESACSVTRVRLSAYMSRYSVPSSVVTPRNSMASSASVPRSRSSACTWFQLRRFHMTSRGRLTR